MSKELIVCDDKGRIVLPKSVRAQFGSEFHLVSALGEVVLIPVSKNPLAELAVLGKSVKRLSIGKIKSELRKQALKEL